MELDHFFELCWKRYSQITPDAPLIHRLLTDRGEIVVNDHVAFRTFNIPGIGKKDLGRVFERWGYVLAQEELDFPEKKLKAVYYIHPDAKKPKVFISELLLEKVSSDLRKWIESLVKSQSPGVQRFEVDDPRFFLHPNWDPIEKSQYDRFYPESEYAAWTAAFGIQVNHFTVFLNELRTFKSIVDLNAFLKQHGILLNSAGGEVKGTPGDKLEQSSTEARKVPCRFAKDITEEIRGCYYEFAKRYPVGESGLLFQGFIPKSADKIFESTYEKK